MNCPGCGAENIDGSKFCRNCGGRLSSRGVDYSSGSRYEEYLRPERETIFDYWGFRGEMSPMYSVRATFSMLALTVFAAAVGAYLVLKAVQGGSVAYAVAAAVVFLAASGLGHLSFQFLKAIYSDPDDGIEVTTTETRAEDVYELTGLPPRR